MKKWLIILSFLVIPAFLVSADDSAPRIENFKVLLTGPRTARLDFSFTQVGGGLSKAEFTIAFEVERNGISLRSGRASGLKFVPAPGTPIKISTSLTGESGEVRAVLPVEETIRVGDKIRYLIYLTDAQSRNSNVVEYTFTFVEVHIL